MASYAPLFAYADAWQWSPDLIWFDNLQSYGTPNYYVQKLFSVNKGTELVAILENGEAVKGKDSLYASSVLDKKAGELVIKIVNASSNTVPVNTTIRGAKPSKKQASVQELFSNDQLTVNNFEAPQTIAPVNGTVPVKGYTVSVSVKPYSLTIIRIPCK